FPMAGRRRRRTAERRLRAAELLNDRRELLETCLPEPADEERVDAPALAKPGELVDQIRDRSDQRERRLEDVLGADLHAGRGGVLASDIACDLARLVRDRDVAEGPQHVEVQLLETASSGVADPADAHVRPLLECVEDRLAFLTQVDPDDVALS